MEVCASHGEAANLGSMRRSFLDVLQVLGVTQVFCHLVLRVRRRELCILLYVYLHPIQLCAPGPGMSHKARPH